MELEDPKTLYKFRSLEGSNAEWTSRIITHSEIYFSSPNDFNDPFDCRLHFRPQVNSDALRNNYERLLTQYRTDLTRQERKSKLMKDLENVNHGEYVRKMSQGFHDVASSLGILCLSNTNSNILLWSHYAANHTGVCLGFAVTKYTPFFGLAQKVKYSRAYPAIDVTSEDHEELAESLLLTKSEDWQYEKEWRIFGFQGSGVRTFPEHCLREVILGARISEENKVRIQSLLTNHDSPVMLYQARVCEGKYAILIEQQ